jgi:hypothetical protein
VQVAAQGGETAVEAVEDDLSPSQAVAPGRRRLLQCRVSLGDVREASVQDVRAKVIALDQHALLCRGPSVDGAMRSRGVPRNRLTAAPRDQVLDAIGTRPGIQMKPQDHGDHDDGDGDPDESASPGREVHSGIVSSGGAAPLALNALPAGRAANPVAQRLRELTEVGLIVRQVDPGPAIKSTYMATSRAAEVQLRIDELRTALGHTISGDELA